MSDCFLILGVRMRSMKECFLAAWGFSSKLQVWRNTRVEAHAGESTRSRTVHAHPQHLQVFALGDPVHLGGLLDQLPRLLLLVVGHQPAGRLGQQPAGWRRETHTDLG